MIDRAASPAEAATGKVAGMTPADLLAACHAEPFRAETGAARIYAADLDGALEPAWDWLDCAERERAARFATEVLRRRYARSRTLLRAVLSAATATPPGDLRIACAANGKPFLADARFPVHFNLSHAAADLRLALAREPVGIDIERLDALRDPDALAREILGSDEHAEWRALAPAARPMALLQAWVAKEAVLKATGEGLSRGLHAIRAPRGGAGHARVESDARGWWVFALSAPRGSAALAARDEHVVLTRLELRDSRWHAEP